MSHIDHLPDTETAFLDRMFRKDAKNYHAWSYRQWLVRYFDMWDSEMPAIEKLLDEDVRNNSAWNHRWFVIFARYTDPERHTVRRNDAYAPVPDNVVDDEIEYTMEAIKKAPQNQSPWLYLRGVLRRQRRPLLTLKPFVETFADLDDEDNVRSSHALEYLADVYAEEQNKEKAVAALNLLSRRYDPIRKNYWDYKANLINRNGQPPTVA